MTTSGRRRGSAPLRLLGSRPVPLAEPETEAIKEVLA
jgi:hypothetical protein